MKKKSLLLYIVPLFFVLGACTSQKQEETQTSQTTQTSVKERVVYVQDEKTKETLKKLEEKQAEEQQKRNERQKLLKDFARKWVNYKDIYHRNQSVRKYLTDKCIEESAIDVDPHVEIHASGNLETIAQDINKSNEYVLTGREHSTAGDQKIMVQLVLTDDNKIDDIRVSYGREVF